MAFSSGTYTLPGPALSTGDTVSATENNTLRNDMASSFNLTWLRNGTAAATADIPMGGYKITGLAAATSTGDALAYGRAATVTDLTTTGNTILGDASTDTLNVGNGGLIKDASGNVGVGVTPSAWNSSWKALQITPTVALVGRSNQNLYLGNNWYLDSGSTDRYIATGYASFYSQVSGAHNWYTAASGTAGNAITFTQAMTLDASGNLGVGTTSPNARITVKAAGNSYTNGALALVGSVSGTSYISGIGGSLYFSNNGSTDHMVLDSSGNLLVGQTTKSQTTVGFYAAATGEVSACQSASTNAATQWNTYSTGASAFRFYVGMGGTIYATSTTISGISDIRLKENIRDLDEGLDVVMALKPRKFDWKEGKGADIKNARGFIAQEFEEVLPDMIDTWKDPAPEGEEPYKAVNANLIPTLVKAIQEMKSIIDDQATRIAALEAK